MIKRRYLVLAAGIIAVTVVVSAYFLLTPKSLREEHIGGKYDAKIIIEGNDTRGFEFGYIIYTKDGIEHTGYYNSYMKSALDWIKINTPENAIFLNWWDYGHMIVGYAERESVIKNPSTEALKSVAEPLSEIKEFDAHEMIVDVAKALTTTNESLTKEIMKKYNAKYLLITTEDGGGKAYWIFYFAGLNFTEYYNPHLLFREQDYTEKGKQTMIYKLLTNSSLQVFIQVYSDENVKIFEI